MRLTKSTAGVVVAFGTSLGAAAVAGCAAPSGQSTHAKNVILFLGDAGGIPTLSAASENYPGVLSMPFPDRLVA